MSLPSDPGSPLPSAPSSTSAKPVLRPVDMHVHIVGNGSGGTGCWLRVRGWHRPLAGLMLRQIGLPASAMRGEKAR